MEGLHLGVNPLNNILNTLALSLLIEIKWEVIEKTILTELYQATDELGAFHSYLLAGLHTQPTVAGAESLAELKPRIYKHRWELVN